MGCFGVKGVFKARLLGAACMLMRQQFIRAQVGLSGAVAVKQILPGLLIPLARRLTGLRNLPLLTFSRLRSDTQRDAGIHLETVL